MILSGTEGGMRKATYALVAIVAVLAVFVIGRYFSGHAGPSLAVQKSCTDAARKMLQNSAGDNYMVRYNVARNKCFVLVESNGLVNNGKDMYTQSAITDVFGHIEYGAFYGTKPRAKTQYTPAVCKMLGDDGKRVNCKTTDEWEAFAKRLMKE
jgi:hypothetical protein